MGHRNNPPFTGRRFICLQGVGNNAHIGTTDELPLEDPYEAITRIAGLVPPVSGSNRASITGSGAFFSEITIPQYVSFDGKEIAFITSDACNVIAGGNQLIEIATMTNTGSGCLLSVDGKNRVRGQFLSMVALGDDSEMFRVSGACDDTSFSCLQGELRGERSVAINHTAQAPTPIVYDINTIEFFNIDQTVIVYDPGPGPVETIVNIGAVQEDPLSTTTGTCVAEVKSGILTLTAGSLTADDLIVVRAGAQLILSAGGTAGDFRIDAGGQALVRDTGVHIGDYHVDGVALVTTLVIDGDIIINGTGSMLLFSQAVTQNITVAAGGILGGIIQFVVGNITINGTFNGVIVNHVGTLTINGVLNGSVNGKRYGNWKVLIAKILEGSSPVNQTPAGLDIPMKISYGPAQALPLVSLSATGDITINESGQYLFTFDLQYGRIGAGGVSWLFFWILIDGNQFGDSTLAKLDNSNSDFPYRVEVPITLTAGQTLNTWLVRDSQGNNSGGLFTELPTLPINPSPSATVTIERIE